MATITPVVTGMLGDGYVTGFWETLTEADTAAGMRLPRPCALGAVSVAGTWGSATVVLQGSLDGTVWFGLGDQAGTAISLTANGGDAAVMPVLYVRPSASGGTSQDLDITLVAIV